MTIYTRSDPDDTKPEYVPLWRRAFERNGHQMITDGEELTDDESFTVYRGQPEGDPVGLSWSLKKVRSPKLRERRGPALSITRWRRHF